MLASIEAAVNRRAWGQQEELLATLIEVTDELLVTFMLANTIKADRHKVREPRRVPRPSEDKPKKRRTWFEVLASMPGGRR